MDQWTKTGQSFVNETGVFENLRESPLTNCKNGSRILHSKYVENNGRIVGYRTGWVIFRTLERIQSNQPYYTTLVK